jgi:hypothetical protein
MKFKNFCTTKEMASKLKKPLTEWEKIFASYTLDKEGTGNQTIQGAQKSKLPSTQ